MTKKWIHIIGIAGVTTSALALEFNRIGWEVTGSDKNVYPPASDLLSDAGTTYYTDFSYKNLIHGEKFPDLVVMTGSKSANNREYLFAKKQGMTIKSYPEVLNDMLVVEGNSIVVTGTYGKTSITAILVYIFQKADKEVSYMFGGFTKSIDKTLQFRNDRTEWSIIEGDEYIASKVDPKSKFFYYSPSILIINSIEWDHTDVFKTEFEYIENFQKLVQVVPEDGKIFVARSESVEKVIEGAKAEVVYFDYENNKVETNLLGEFNKQNSAFAYQIAVTLGIEPDIAKQSILEFKGIDRRLEKRFEQDGIVVIDDFGSSPAKARGSLSSIRKEYPESKIVTIFEPNEGARTTESLDIYGSSTFEESDVVFFPHFRGLPERLSEKELYEYIKDTDSPKVDKYKMVSDEELIDSLLKEVSEETVFIFMGSHNFENLIQELVKRLRSE